MIWGKIPNFEKYYLKSKFTVKLFWKKTFIARPPGIGNFCIFFSSLTFNTSCSEYVFLEVLLFCFHNHFSYILSSFYWLRAGFHVFMNKWISLTEEIIDFLSFGFFSLMPATTLYFFSQSRKSLGLGGTWKIKGRTKKKKIYKYTKKN